MKPIEILNPIEKENIEESIKFNIFMAKLHSNPRWALDEHRQMVKYYARIKRKLKKPVNKTGEPLKDNTMRSYSSKLKYFKGYIKSAKKTIKMMVQRGFFRHTNPKVVSLDAYRKWVK